MDRTTALVLVEAVAIGLLGLLVAGLLRSHAEILRQLHRLGADMDPSARPAPARREVGAVEDVAGVTPSGDAARFSLGRVGERTMLLFLSSGCVTCAGWWDGLGRGRHREVLPDARVIVVTRDADEESPGLLLERAAAGVPIVMSSAAWDQLRVPGSPYAVLVDGGQVVGSGAARTWEQLGSFVDQHGRDASIVHLDGAARERRADDELRAAGVHPGHPSLYRS
jgi:hypothetical protein